MRALLKTFPDAATFNASPLTTKGDLYGYSTVNARVAVGADGTALVADSTQGSGLNYANRSKLLYVNTADSNTISNPGINTETAFSLTYAIPAAVWATGKCLRVVGDFLCDGGALNSTTIQLTTGGTVTGGGVSLMSTGVQSATSTTATQWRFVTLLVCRSTGASGTLASATVEATKLGSTAIQVLQTVATVDMTGSLTLGYTINFSTSLGTDSGIQRHFSVEQLN